MFDIERNVTLVHFQKEFLICSNACDSSFDGFQRESVWERFFLRRDIFFLKSYIQILIIFLIPSWKYDRRVNKNRKLHNVHFSSFLPPGLGFEKKLKKMASCIL